MNEPRKFLTREQVEKALPKGVGDQDFMVIGEDTVEDPDTGFSYEIELVIPVVPWDAFNFNQSLEQVWTRPKGSKNRAEYEKVSREQLAGFFDLVTLRRHFASRILTRELLAGGTDPLVLRMPDVIRFLGDLSSDTPVSQIAGLMAEIGKSPLESKKVFEEFQKRGAIDKSLAEKARTIEEVERGKWERQELNRLDVAERKGAGMLTAQRDWQVRREDYARESEYLAEHIKSLDPVLENYKERFESKYFDPLQVGAMDEQVAYAYYLSQQQASQRLAEIESGTGNPEEVIVRGEPGIPRNFEQEARDRERQKLEAEFRQLSNRFVRTPRRRTAL